MEVALSKRRTERLLSIVVLLLSSRRYLTAEQIRAAVSGYPEDQESFKRMFERDKEELRDLGIPLETGRATHSDDDLGYRISRQDYELPEIHLEPDEAAVLGIASRVWQSAELAGAAAGAALKLRAASREADGDGRAAPPPGIQPRLTTQEPAFGPLWDAVREYILEERDRLRLRDQVKIPAQHLLTGLELPDRQLAAAGLRPQPDEAAMDLLPRRIFAQHLPQTIHRGGDVAASVEHIREPQQQAHVQLGQNPAALCTPVFVAILW